jgi:hypothetical protein
MARAKRLEVARVRTEDAFVRIAGATKNERIASGFGSVGFTGATL